MAAKKDFQADDGANLMKLFKAFDKDEDNRIAITELPSVLKLVFVSDPDKATLHEWMAKFDTDKSGYIEFEEFVEMHKGLKQIYKQRESLEKIFNEFDVDKDGRLTPSEIRDLIITKEIVKDTNKAVIDEKVQKYMKAADVDGDGSVSFEEFCRVFVKLF